MAPTVVKIPIAVKRNPLIDVDLHKKKKYTINIIILQDIRYYANVFNLVSISNEQIRIHMERDNKQLKFVTDD